jgi:tetratricopeptide (TPR) repeat protein
MYRRGNYKAAERFFQDCQIQAEAIGYQLMLGVLQLGQAWLVMDRAGDWEQARIHLQKGIDTVQELEQRMWGRMLAELGGIAVREGQFLEAEEHLQKALHIAGKTGEFEIAIVAYKYLGLLAGKQGIPQQAETYFQEAMIMARQYKDTWHLGTVLQTWGEWQLALAADGAALKVFSELMVVAQQAGFASLLAVACFGLAQVHLRAGRYTKAQQMGQESLHSMHRLGHHLESEV